jgi:trypsin
MNRFAFLALLSSSCTPYICGSDGSGNNYKVQWDANVLTTPATTQYGATFDDNGPRRSLNGREEESAKRVKKPDTKVKKTKQPRDVLNSKDIPIESRIVGGNNAQQGEYPFFVQGNGCGGSLIWDDIVLTAAHCEGLPFDSGVLIGPHIVQTISANTEFIGVQRQVPHPTYDMDTTTEVYDFMLLKLANPVANPNLTPIAVNSLDKNPLSNDLLTVIGFGATFEGSSTWSTRLQEVNVNYIDFETCNDLYDGAIVDSIMFCAGVPGGGKDSCQGDSGGPIFDQEGIQVGVTSFGIGCAQAAFPGVYARVSGVKDWIDATLCELASTPPASCGQIQTNTGNNVVVIEVKYDDFPEETGWTLRDSAGTLIASQATGSFLTFGGFVSKTVFVTEGDYTFEMTDTKSDGICCEFGIGEFKITVNGEPVAVGDNGEFSDVVREFFNVGGVDVVEAPTGDNEVVIEVLHDDFPEETGWTLRDSAGILIVSQFTGSFRILGGTASKTVFVVAGAYTFEVTDTESDGICCKYGIGEFKITVNGEPVVVGDNGEFGDVIQNTFDVVDVVEAPTRAPTSALVIPPTIPSDKNEVSAGTFAILSGSCCLVLLLQLLCSS